jgi:hypothetical protein
VTTRYNPWPNEIVRTKVLRGSFDDHVHTTELDVGQMFQGAFRVVFRNPIPFFILGLVLEGVPSGLFQFALKVGVPGRPASPYSLFDWKIMLGGYALLLLGMGLYHIAAVRAVLDDAAGKKASLADCLATMFQRMVPGLALGAVFVIGYIATALFFIIPGLIFMTVYYVALPVLVAEGKGVFASFGRSARLTSGRRWAVFGSMFLVGLVLSIANALIAGIGGMIVIASGFPAGVAIIQGLVTAITGPPNAALSTIVYLRLVRLREGGESKKLEEVFA